MSNTEHIPLQATEIYVFENRDKCMCVRFSSGSTQTKRIVLTPDEADQLLILMVNVVARYVALDFTQEQDVKEP